MESSTGSTQGEQANGLGPVAEARESPEVPVLETPKQDAARKAGGLERRDKPEKALSAQEQADATAWFLEEEPDEVPTRAFQVNVGVDRPRWVTWRVRAIDRDELRVIRRRAQGRRGAEDDLNLNLQIAAAGTVDPPIESPRLRGQFADPASALAARLRNKQGLIDQIAGEVLTASGYDDTDVREVAAAKNS
jgi:hypothetical protein